MIVIVPRILVRPGVVGLVRMRPFGARLLRLLRLLLRRRK